MFISWIQTSYSSSSSNQQEEDEQENNDSGSNADTGTDDWSDMESSHEESNSDTETPHVLLKRKPTHSWNVIKGKSYHHLLSDEDIYINNS